ncbi:MAG: helical backbone metal receptor [Candidatus Eisenbacteria bacterium]
MVLARRVVVGLCLSASVLLAPTRCARAAEHGLLIDALGDTLPAGPYPARIVSLSPNLTEALFALGVAPERIVGRTRYCDYPKAALARPDMGGIVDPSIERIQNAHPDLVLVARGNPVEVQEQIRAIHIAVFALEDRNDLAGIGSVLSDIARVVGPDNPARAESLLTRFRAETEAYAAWAAEIPEAERPRVYFADPDNPGFTAGPGSHIDDLLRHAGARNLVTTGGAWPKYSSEALLVAQPDFLLIALPSDRTRDDVVAQLRRDPAMSALRAVARGAICFVDAGTLLRPGPRLVRALEEIADCVQTERPRPKGAWNAAPATPAGSMR